MSLIAHELFRKGSSEIREKKKKRKGGGTCICLTQKCKQFKCRGGLNVLTPARQKFKQTRPNVSGRGKQHMGKHAN